MKKVVAAMAVLAVALVGSSARAQDVGPFQIEAEFSIEIEADGYGDLVRLPLDMDTTTVGVGGGYAFKSVDPGTGPLDEALFLARVPYAGARLGFTSGEFGSADLSGTELRIMGVYADENIPVVADLMLMTGALDIDAAGVSGDMDRTAFALKAGYLAMPNLLVGLSYGSETMKMKVSGTTLAEMDMSSIGVAGKLVQELGNGTALNVEVAYSTLTVDTGAPDDWEATRLAIGADYYLTQLIGVGLGLEFFAGDEDDDDQTTFEIRARWNLNTNFGAGISIGTTSYEASGVDDSTVFEISAVGRF